MSTVMAVIHLVMALPVASINALGLEPLPNVLVLRHLHRLPVQLHAAQQR
jgi:hypothetical protein